MCSPRYMHPAKARDRMVWWSGRSRVVVSRIALSKIARVLFARGFVVEYADPRFFYDVIDDLFEVSCLARDLNLAVGAAAHIQHLVNVIDLVARSQFVHD